MALLLIQSHTPGLLTVNGQFCGRVDDSPHTYITHADDRGYLSFLHNRSGIGPTIRYVSDWSKIIYAHLKEKITQGRETLLTAKTKIHMIDFKKNKFKEVGEAYLYLLTVSEALPVTI